jgi:hypothetical protein
MLIFLLGGLDAGLPGSELEATGPLDAPSGPGTDASGSVFDEPDWLDFPKVVSGGVKLVAV